MTELPFLEDDVRRLYRFLNHAGYATVAHCQVPGQKFPLDRRLVYAEQELVEWAATYNGKGNCYVGRNPRSGQSADSVVCLTSFSFDLDPERAVGAPASDAGRTQCLGVAKKLCAMLPGGGLVDSGNGYQVVYSWAPKEGINVEEFGRKSKVFLEQTERFLGEARGVKLDRIHDPERLIRLPGTVNVKGGRLSSFVTPPVVSGAGELVFARIVAQVVDRPQRETAERPDRPLTDEIQAAARALGQIKQSRCDTYQDWLNVGMSLRSLGDCGLQLWEEWSKKSERWQEGVCSEKWATFEPGVPGEGVTLGSLIAWAREDGAGGPQSNERRADPAASGGGSSFSFSTGELLNYAKDVTWLVPGLIPQQGAVIIGGQEGVGKSWLALDLATATSRGLPWLGALPTRKCRVLYLDEESSPQLLKRRLSRLLKGQEAPGADDLVFRVGGGVNFSDPTWIEGFTASLRAKPVDLIIVDSLVRSHRGEENSSTELAKVFGAVKRLISEHGVSVLFLDHESKHAMGPADDGQGKREPSTRDLRGSNEKGAFADSIVLAKRVGPQLALHHVKSRWTEATPPFTVSVYDTPEGATLVRRV